MADYKGIKGSTIQTIAGDPANPIFGQVWYNSTSNVLKGYAEGGGAGAWAAGGDINTTRNNAVGCGIQTAALIAIGAAPAPTRNITETYDGTSWTDGVACLTARESGCMFGTTTAAINTSGQRLAINESYNGTSWSEVNDAISGSSASAGLGTQTAGMCLGGYRPSGYSSLSETWDGTCYTEGNNMNQCRNAVDNAGGTTTAGIIVGGSCPPATKLKTTELYDGTCWTETTDLSGLARGQMGVSTAGNQTAYLVAGGHAPAAPSPMDIVEEWNGTTWSEQSDLATVRDQVLGAGTSSAQIICGGSNGVIKIAPSEEWTKPDAVVTFTSS